MKKLRKARKTLRDVNILPQIEELMPNDLTQAQQAKYIIRCSEWLGGDHCSSCGLQNDHCSCDFLDFKSRIPRSKLVRDKYTHQSGEEATVPPTPPPTPEPPVGGQNRILSYREAVVERLRLHKEKNPGIRYGRSRYQPQSGVMPDDMNLRPSGTINGTNNIVFSDQPGGMTYDVGGVMDHTRNDQDDPPTYIQDIFKRPVKIFSSDWGTGTTFGDSFNPWSLYFTHPSIIKRIDNFMLARCKLHLKFVINGNGFQYGRLLVNYLPLDIWDDFSTNAFLVPEDAIQASQQQHLYLNPTTSTGGEMVLPFFNQYNNMIVPFYGWDEMGSVFIRSLNTLKHANGASDQATITVFAWAEDMTMTGLTSFTAQSGTEVDQANSRGMISGPATSIAKVAKALVQIPMIGKYAKATDMVMSTIAATAKLFGYSRPSITKEPDPFRPATVGNMATTTVPDSCLKLSVDDKQELSIDPNIVGLSSCDALAIRNIATRESYLTTFNWAIGTAEGDILWNSRVTPCLFATSGGTAIHLPACAAAALPFTSWSGSMRYRFQFVTSAFHKGRIQISYDGLATVANGPDTAVTYNRIVDLSEETDVTVQVGQSQEIPWLPCIRVGTGVPSDLYGTLPFTGNDFFCNGVIALHVLNELTTPNSTVNNDIQVNVFVSCGDDVEFAAPTDFITHFTFKPQSGLEVVDGLSPLQDQPQHADVKDLANPSTTDVDRSLVFYGEKILSFRQLLKRYNHWKSVAVGNDSGGAAVAVYKARQNMFPYWRGNVTGAIDTTGAAAPYNYVNTTLIHWLAAAHQGWRGSIRYKIVPRYMGTGQFSVAANRVSHFLADTSFVEDTVYLSGILTRSQGHSVGMYRDGVGVNVPSTASPMFAIDGGNINSSTVNGALEIEIPFYSPLRFSPGKRQNMTDTNVILEDLWDLSIARVGTGTAGANLFDIFVATGEDFQFYNWTGMPRIYYEQEPPPIS